MFKEGNLECALSLTSHNSHVKNSLINELYGLPTPDLLLQKRMSQPRTGTWVTLYYARGGASTFGAKQEPFFASWATLTVRFAPPFPSGLVHTQK